MDKWLIICLSLFIVCTTGVVVYVKLNHRRLKMRRMRSIRRHDRLQYIRENAAQLQRDMCESRLTVYVDEELDQLHATRASEYERLGMDAYDYYIETSKELVWLENHIMSFDVPLAYELIHTFCSVRYLFLRLLLRNNRHVVQRVIKLLYRELSPLIDYTTIPMKRAYQAEVIQI